MENTPKTIVPISIAPEVRRAEHAAFHAAGIQASILAYRLRLIGRAVFGRLPKGIPSVTYVRNLQRITATALRGVFTQLP